MNPSDVADWLAAAPFEELVRVTHEGFARRSDVADDAAHRYLVGLAIAADDGSGWEISMAARADRRVYEGEPPHGEPWCQFGACASCGLELTGATKHVVCPNCGTSAFLT